MSRSWFYLTLWNGTPPSFTDDFDVIVKKGEGAVSSIESSNAFGSAIETALNALSNINTKENASSEVITITDAVWYIGGKEIVSNVETSNAFGSVIDTAVNVYTEIGMEKSANTEIITKTEVVWYV